MYCDLIGRLYIWIGMMERNVCEGMETGIYIIQHFLDPADEELAVGPITIFTDQWKLVYA